jgi:hypothetical protein
MGHLGKVTPRNGRRFKEISKDHPPPPTSKWAKKRGNLPRAGELREQMKRASEEISKDPARMRAAEREGIAPQVRNFVRQAEREQGREKGKGVEKDEGLER